MTISYTLDVSQTSTRSVFKLLCRWRGSIWKAVLYQLLLWTAGYMVISVLYRFALPRDAQTVFERISVYLNTSLDSYIPLTFMLGFFVTFVVSRWSSILSGIGWIDSAALAISTYIRGSDEETRIMRRTLIRYLVLNQVLVLRDISMQVRKRFPTLETLEAAGILTMEELKVLEAIEDPYSRYWTPIQWCQEHVYQARLLNKITSDFIWEKVNHEIQDFRHGLSTLLKYDWVPVPLLYPQVIFLAVRIYFFICLFSRQFLQNSEPQLWVPLATMIQFVVYMGWTKVAEALLNPLGEDDDDLECNYVIDKNLITGMTLVDQGVQAAPTLTKDCFLNQKHIAPLYSLEAAERTVHPLIGSACNVNLVKNVKKITMTPHKNQLVHMSEEEQNNHTKIIDVAAHNLKHSEQRSIRKEQNPNKVLSAIRRRSQAINHQLQLNLANNAEPKESDGRTASPRQPRTQNTFGKEEARGAFDPEALRHISPRIPPIDSRYQPYDGPANVERGDY